MSHLAKLNLKTVQRTVQKDPVIARREKLLAGVAEQQKVLEAALAGKDYTVSVKRWKKNDAGEKALVETEKTVRAWFFEQDGGWYVQCKYGARPVPLNKDANAVFVKELKAVKSVLEAFAAACGAGEMDEQLAALTTRKRK